MCENTLYRQGQKQMTVFSLGARLHLGANSDFAFSLPQSYRLNPERSPTAPSSEGAEGAPAPCTELMPRNSFIVRRSYSPRRLVRYSAFRILHSAFRILHSAFCIPHSAFCILHSAFRIPDYLLQIALLPQGSAMPVAVTGRPISSAETLPPNFFILTPSTYSMVEAESPVV